jgi:hypothetical protein
VTATDVIAGAAALPRGAAGPVALLEVPGLVELAVEDPGQGPQVRVHNSNAAGLTVVMDGGGELAVAPGASVAVPLHATADGAALHLHLLSAAGQRAVTAVVSLEAGSDDAIAVAQAIGAEAR